MDVASRRGQNAEVVRGGKAIYGAAVGILMLDARFPRIPGDMGNARTWSFPVLYRIVRGASPDLVVRQNAGAFWGRLITAKEGKAFWRKGSGPAAAPGRRRRVGLANLGDVRATS